MTQQQLTTDYNAMALRGGKPDKTEEKQATSRARLREFCDAWPLVQLTIGTDSDATQHGVYLPGVDTDVLAEIRQAATTMTEGGTFTAEQRRFFADIAAEYLQRSTVAFEAVNTLTGGKEREAFAPFADWAESLCANKRGLIRLHGNIDGITLDIPSEGVLKHSMQAVLLSLTTGRKWEGLTVKMARKAFTAELAGESEEITALGTVSVIGSDKSGYMVKLAERLHEAVDALQKGEGQKAAIAIFSQSRFTSIPVPQFVIVVQAALYGRYAYLCKRLSETAARIAKDGARAEAVQAVSLAEKTAKRPANGKAAKKSAPLVQPQLAA